jgi:hypothetical protein
VDNFEINQSRVTSGLVIKHVVRACIPMRPSAAELITPNLMRAAQFMARCLHHFSCERAFFQMVR